MFASFIYRNYFSNEYELNKRYFKQCCQLDRDIEDIIFIQALTR